MPSKKTKAKPKARAKPKPSPARPKGKAAARPRRPSRPAAKPKPAPPKGTPVPAPAQAGKLARPAKPGVATPAAAKPSAPRPSASKSKAARRSTLFQRRGPDGQLLMPGDVLIPGGCLVTEEVQYLFRGVIATQRPVGDAAWQEVVSKRPAGDPLANRSELERQYATLMQRFQGAPIEPSLPNRPQPKRSFQGFIERARGRRREIGAFLRGLDIGKTESSQMDSHGEASLQSLMEWAARLEKLVEDAREPAQGDYTKFHRFLDQLDHTTEALIVDVESTLRRLGARVRN